MNIKTFVLGNLQSNCYVLYNDLEILVIDPGYESMELVNFIKNLNLDFKTIYITHGHFDHVGGVKLLKTYFPDVIIYAPLKDDIWYKKGSYSPLDYDIPVDKFVVENDTIMFSNFKFRVIETPGHSKGSTALYYDKLLFSGDNLFFMSIGRTDLPFGDYSELIKTIKNKLYTLDENTVVYPGHGISTTIKYEKLNNPFTKKI